MYLSRYGNTVRNTPQHWYAWEVLKRAEADSFSSIRIYLGSRLSWIANGDESALKMMEDSVQWLSQPEYDAVKELGDIL